MFYYPPNCFLNASHPIGVTVPYAVYFRSDKKQLSNLLVTESWCERRDTVLLRKPCILVDPMLRIRYPTSDFEAKNSSLNCFLDASHPLRVQVPYMIYFLVSKKQKTRSFDLVWCERRDLTLGLRASVIRGHNSPPDCCSVPLLLQVPYAVYLMSDKKQLSNLLVTESWCERRDLNPYELPHTPLKRARLPIPPLSHIHFTLSSARILYHFQLGLSILFPRFFSTFFADEFLPLHGGEAVSVLPDFTAYKN